MLMVNKKYILCSLLPLALLACQKKTAEERGADAANEKIGYVQGIGNALQTKGQDAAHALGAGVGQVAKGTGGGLEAGFAEFAVRLAPSATQKGLKINNARRNGESSPIVDEKSSAVTEGGKVVTAYLLAGSTLIKTKVRLLALDKTDKELGRASVNLELAAGDAKYVDFKFDSRTPLNEVSTVVLEAD